jgi:uncharacterized protein
MEKIRTIKNIIGLYSFILVVWGFYRFLFKLPDQIEELFFKPLIWMIPVFYLLFKGKENFSSIGWSTKNLYKSLYLGIGLGIVFAIEGAAVNGLKYGQFSFVAVPYTGIWFLISALGLTLVTAFVEETVFRGYIFSRLLTVIKGEWKANILSSVAWVIVHLPVTIFVWHYAPEQMVVYFLLAFIFGVGSAFVYMHTGTIVASVLLHVFWSWPIILFR